MATGPITPVMILTKGLDNEAYSKKDKNYC